MNIDSDLAFTSMPMTTQHGHLDGEDLFDKDPNIHNNNNASDNDPHGSGKHNHNTHTNANANANSDDFDSIDGDAFDSSSPSLFPFPISPSLSSLLSLLCCLFQCDYSALSVVSVEKYLRSNKGDVLRAIQNIRENMNHSVALSAQNTKTKENHNEKENTQQIPKNEGKHGNNHQSVNSDHGAQEFNQRDVDMDTNQNDNNNIRNDIPSTENQKNLKSSNGDKRHDNDHIHNNENENDHENVGDDEEEDVDNEDEENDNVSVENDNENEYDNEDQNQRENELEEEESSSCSSSPSSPSLPSPSPSPSSPSPSLSQMSSQMKVKSKKKVKERVKSLLVHDDICAICGDGGDLLICDHSLSRCPLVYHVECLGLKNIPTGKWNCPRHKCHVCSKQEIIGGAMRNQRNNNGNVHDNAHSQPETEESPSQCKAKSKIESPSPMLIPRHSDWIKQRWSTMSTIRDSNSPSLLFLHESPFVSSSSPSGDFHLHCSVCPTSFCSSHVPIQSFERNIHAEQKDNNNNNNNNNSGEERVDSHDFFPITENHFTHQWINLFLENQKENPNGNGNVNRLTNTNPLTNKNDPSPLSRYSHFSRHSIPSLVSNSPSAVPLFLFFCPPCWNSLHEKKRTIFIAKLISQIQTLSEFIKIEETSNNPNPNENEKEREIVPTDHSNPKGKRSRGKGEEEEEEKDDPIANEQNPSSSLKRMKKNYPENNTNGTSNIQQNNPNPSTHSSYYFQNLIQYFTEKHHEENRTNDNEKDNRKEMDQLHFRRLLLLYKQIICHGGTEAILTNGKWKHMQLDDKEKEKDNDKEKHEEIFTKESDEEEEESDLENNENENECMNLANEDDDNAPGPTGSAEMEDQEEI